MIAWVGACGSSHASDDDDGSRAGAGAMSGGSAGMTGAGGAGRAGAGGSMNGGSSGADTGGTEGGTDGEAGTGVEAGTGGTGGGSGGSGGSGAAAEAGDGGEAGTTTTVPLSCTLPALTSDFEHDWDVTVAHVSGNVTLLGAVMPDSPDVTSRGSVWLHDRDHGSSYVFALGASGSADFDGMVFASHYDVDFVTTNDVALLGMPANQSVRLATDVTIDTDVTLPLNADTVIVSGTVTANGATMPTSAQLGSRGGVVFHDEVTGSEYSMVVGGSGGANFNGVVFASSYAIDFLTSSDDRLVGLPVNAIARLARGVVLEDRTADLAYDVRPHSVGGNALVNGEVMPDSPLVPNRGTIVFHPLPWGNDQTFEVSASGDASYAGFVFEGDYDVDFVTVNDYDLVGMPPNSGVRIGHETTVAGPSTLDFDLHVVTVDGTVTRGGAVMPDSPLTAYRGKMLFNDLTTGTVTELWVTPTGAATFGGLLFESSYEVLFHSVPDMNVVGLPRDRSVEVKDREVIGGPVSLAYDVRPITVTGTLTANGAALPDSSHLTTRGNVVLRDARSGQKYSVPLSNAGPGAFTADVFASTYAVIVETAQDETLVGLPSYARAHVASRETLTGSKALSYDLNVVQASGTVTLAGGELPSSPGVTTRGTVGFQERFVGSGGGSRLGATGPGTYSTLLFAGAYDVSFSTTSDTDLVGLPINVAKRLAVGCVPARECSKSAADLSGLWLFQGGFGEVDADLLQTGTEVSGNLHGQVETILTFGARDGDSVELYSSNVFPCEPFVIRLTVVDGCTLVGTTSCGDELVPGNRREIWAVR